eukprot:GILJ01017994.1.p1 GENE.GILJ01017994.1~~GILJ01017994.1.p1  ORF type:complete len:275 (-),score=64.63 GILJ01017994.1:125-838(-)
MMERSGNGGFNGLRRTLRIMDDNGDHKLTPLEFAEGLQTYGINYSKEDVDRLFKFLDRDRNGAISLTEFIRGIRPEPSMRRQDLVLRAFKLIDTNGSGVADLAEIGELYDATQHPEVLAGKASVEDVLKDFMQVWDQNKDGKVTLEEFREYYADIGANIDSDDYFELMIRNAWHISGGEGVCRNTTCLRVLVTFNDGRTQVLEVKDDLRIKRGDTDAIKAKLAQQGVEGIKSISTAN